MQQHNSFEERLLQETCLLTWSQPLTTPSENSTFLLSRL